MASSFTSHADGSVVPGIIEAPLEGRARIAGTGIDVWDVVRRYRALHQDFTALRAAYHWLTEEQLRAAIRYAERHEREIEERLQREAATRLEYL